MPPNFDWSNVAILPRAPAGNTSAATQLFYHWLYANYFGSIPKERIFDLWSGPMYLFGFLIILAIAIGLYARMGYVHRHHNELYGVESFGGVILERIGRVDAFTFVVSLMCVLWALYFVVSQLWYGQVY